MLSFFSIQTIMPLHNFHIVALSTSFYFFSNPSYFFFCQVNRCFSSSLLTSIYPECQIFHVSLLPYMFQEFKSLLPDSKYKLLFNFSPLKIVHSMIFPASVFISYLKFFKTKHIIMDKNDLDIEIKIVLSNVNFSV